MKAASAELKGLMNYYSCNIPGLLTPLMAVIDYRYKLCSHNLPINYRGFRLTAVAQLNIDKSTLVYGNS
jgi:hypothetical protein